MRTVEGTRTHVRGEGRASAIVRRLLDVLLATIGLLLLAIPTLLAMLAIRIEDGGPALFRQRRYGRFGTVFTLSKLRTMRVGSSNEAATVDDDRVTKVGRVLRAIGLDEAPQLVHILIGQMSFVGPRALSVDERIDGLRYEELPGFAERHLVRPGLTGPAAFFLPKDVHWRTKFAADRSYAEHRALGEDVKLIVVSIAVSVLGRWEDRGSKLKIVPPRWLIEAVDEAA